jgi:hypothetical protein
MGRQIGRGLVPDSDAPAETKTHATLTGWGFNRVGSAPATVLTHRLGICPYRDAVRENADVCTQHREITRGLLEEPDPSGALSDWWLVTLIRAIA